MASSQASISSKTNKLTRNGISATRRSPRYTHSSNAFTALIPTPAMRTTPSSSSLIPLSNMARNPSHDRHSTALCPPIIAPSSTTMRTSVSRLHDRA